MALKMRRRKGTKKRGGRRIGKGRTGTVYTPPLLCEEKMEQYTSTEYVSKLTSKDIAEKEIAKADVIKSIDPSNKYSIYALHICKIADVQENTNYTDEYKEGWIVIMKNGGRDLTDLYFYAEKVGYSNSKQKVPVELLRNFFSKIVELGYFIVMMNENNLYHNDISADNLVWDYENGNIRLIDFELSTLGPIIRKNTTRRSITSLRKKNEKNIAMTMMDKINVISFAKQMYSMLRMRKDLYTLSDVNIQYTIRSAGDYTNEMYIQDLEALASLQIDSVAE
jgi:serine/threonine protein kinase